jgi:hypothetical protein
MILISVKSIMSKIINSKTCHVQQHSGQYADR